MEPNQVTAKQHAVAFALIVAMAIVVALTSDASPRKGGVVATTACYLALSSDLGPLIDERAPDVAPASAACAPPRDAGHETAAARVADCDG